MTGWIYLDIRFCIAGTPCHAHKYWRRHRVREIHIQAQASDAGCLILRLYNQPLRLLLYACVPVGSSPPQQVSSRHAGAYVLH